MPSTENISSFAGLSLAGAARGKLHTFTSASGTVTINKSAMTVTAATNTKTYDGTTSAAATPTITSGQPRLALTPQTLRRHNNKNAKQRSDPDFPPGLSMMATVETTTMLLSRSCSSTEVINTEAPDCDCGGEQQNV